MNKYEKSKCEYDNALFDHNDHVLFNSFGSLYWSDPFKFLLNTDFVMA